MREGVFFLYLVGESFERLQKILTGHVQKSPNLQVIPFRDTRIF